MGITMGPNGQLINTSNIGNTVGSNLIPNITPNIGALRNIDRPITNDDGTITLPTIQMKSNDPGLAMGDLQKIYGTKYMPMFQWVSAQQTGSTTYDPSKNFTKDFEEFTEDFGIDPNDAFNQAQMERAGQRLAGATGAKFGASVGEALVGGGDVEDALSAGFGAINPLGFLNKNTAPEASEYGARTTPVAGGLGVSPVPKPRPDNLVMGTSPIGPTVTVSTSNASNIAEGRFEGIRDKLEALGYTVSANGSSVYTADGQVAGENWSGSSTISNMLKENQDQNVALASTNNNSTAKAPVNTQTFGALPDGVTQQMITDSQNDGEYGYYNNDGSYVPKEIDKYNGGGPDYSGVRFASGGGAQFDLDGDRFLSKTEMGIGEAAGKELDENFWSKAGTGLGVTSLGSGQDPTGVAKWAEKLLVPGGSTIRKLSPPAFERPLSSYDPNNPYADVGEDAPNIWWEKGKTNPIGFEYKRTPAEVLADRTASREKAAIDAANEITNNDNDNGPRTRREDLYGTRMTTEEYRRRYKGGGGAALPAYMRKYASGKSIDELVRKVKVNGKDYFLTPDGRYIEPSAFTGAAASRDIDVVETGEEQYLEGYNVIDESTGIITTYNTDGSIMEVFDPNFESEEA